MSCADPISFETLVALWSGESDDAVEAHLFECDTCAATSAQLGKMIGSLRRLVPPVVTRAQRDALEAGGAKILDMSFAPGERGEAFFARDLDLLVFSLRGDLANAERVDLEILDPNGGLQLQFPYVPFDAARGEVLVACQQHFRELGNSDDDVPEFRVFAHEDGQRRLIGAYVIRHVWPPL